LSSINIETFFEGRGNPVNISDEMLILQVKSGDTEAFDQLVARYESKVYTIAYRFAGNYNDAADLAQEAFIRVYRSLNSFRGDSTFQTWLYRVVTNVCKDELKRRTKDNLVSMDEMAEKGLPLAVTTEGKNPEDMILTREWQEQLQKLLNLLSAEHRTVLIMRDIQGYSYEEIAFSLKCSLGTVKSRLSRARNILKDLLIKSGRLETACPGQ
jgi:RNA polymerase sigma-70 factor (ECF subfamily)